MPTQARLLVNPTRFTRDEDTRGRACAVVGEDMINTWDYEELGRFAYLVRYAMLRVHINEGPDSICGQLVVLAPDIPIATVVAEKFLTPDLLKGHFLRIVSVALIEEDGLITAVPEGGVA